ncbi:MAG TPA: hypothetical protein VK809_05930 [Bacteroidia bacterium]|nr:hypothetical protein [Bacteroidia bacterium]
MNKLIPSISFKIFEVSVHKYAFILGKFSAHLEDLHNTPVLPSVRNEFLRAKIAIGIYSVLALEGSEVSIEQVEQVQAGNSLSAGKSFLESQVKKMAGAEQDLFRDIVIEKRHSEITPEFIKKMHSTTSGKEITYSNEQDEWLRNFCEWLRSEIVPIHPQPEIKAILKAILAHAYFEWMQPLENGGKQTSQLLQLAILLEGGIPYLLAHILPVFYYETRTEHQRRLELVKKDESPNGFIEYALQGFCDGLEDILRTLQAQQFIITWQHYIVTTLTNAEDAIEKVTTRRKELMQAFPLNLKDGLKFEEVLMLTPAIARVYAKSVKTARRDILALTELGLLTKKKMKYYPNVTAILGEMALKSSLIKLEQLKKRKVEYSHHVMPMVSAMEFKSELLQTLNELNRGE